MTGLRCHICTRPRDHDRDPYVVALNPSHYAADHYFVALRNGRYVDACWSCWFKWPDGHKLWPELGFGRDVGDVLRETRP